jgi:hypothetical protein
MVVATSFVFLCSSCASSTLIKSVPSGAKVYIDGQYRGNAPVTHRDTAVLGSSKAVVLKCKGYRDITGTIRKEELAVGPLIGAIFVAVPILWVLGYPDEYTFELEPEPDHVGMECAA